MTEPVVGSAQARTHAHRVIWALPAYNEGAFVEDLLDHIAEVSSAQRWDWSVIVVDDGSRDDTFLGLSYVAVAVVAVVRLGEWLTPAQWLGILLVVCGVLMVALTAG